MAIEPITRKEQFLAKAGGQQVRDLKPITREEMLLQKIAENGAVQPDLSQNDPDAADFVKGKEEVVFRPDTAEVGQTIVVKSVDENGKPTEWEAATAGDKWRKIKEETFDGSGVASVTITEDEDGNEISLKKIVFIFAAPNSTSSSFALNIRSESKFNQLFYSTTYGDHKNASCPIIGFVDASMPYFTGWIAKTSGYFNQNNLYSLGGARDPRVASENITSITLGLGVAGADWHLGADCVYEIWGVDA